MSENRVLRRGVGPEKDSVTEARENCTMRSFIFVFYTSQYWGDEMKENEIVGEGKTHGRAENAS
jgi:hypothetical protein